MSKRRKTPEDVKLLAQYGQTNPRRMYDVKREKKLFFKFTDREAFGNFCLKLNNDQVSFELGGFQTVIFTKENFDNLVITSAQAHKIYQKYRRQKLVDEVKQVPYSALAGRRYLPDEEETEELLKELAEGF